MATLAEAMAAAASHQAAGNLQEAARICQHVVAVDAQNFAAWHLLGLVALGAATTIAIERPSRAADPIPIKFVMDWAWEGTQASWAVASDSGCYAKAGLDVKTDRGFGSGDAIGKVVAGAYDIDVADFSTSSWACAQRKSPR